MSYTQTPPSGGKKKTWIIWLLTVLIILGIAAYFYFKPSSESKPEDTLMEEEATPTEEPSPTPEINREAVKIQILNGTGTPGEASSAVEALTLVGYKENNIDTGNADEYNHTTASVQAKAGSEVAAEDIKNTLSSLFTGIEVDSTVLDANSDYDVIVTTGGEIFEEPTEEPTSEPTKASTPASSPTVATTPAESSTPTPSPTP